MLASIGYAVAYTGVGLALLAVGFFALDLLTPGHLGRHIYEHRSVNAATVLAAGFLGQGMVIFATIWTNATSGFGTALLYTVVFGVLATRRRFRPPTREEGFDRVDVVGPCG